MLRLEEDATPERIFGTKADEVKAEAEVMSERPRNFMVKFVSW